MAGQNRNAAAGRSQFPLRTLGAGGLIVMLLIGAWLGWRVYTDYQEREQQRQQLAECEILKVAGKTGGKRYEYLHCDSVDSLAKQKPKH